MDVNRSFIVATVDQGDGHVLVTGADTHGNQATVQVGRDMMADGTVYVLLNLALDKVRQTREHLASIEQAEADER